MDIGPIFRAMTRNKLGVILIALQIAFTMTVIINAIFIINERSRLMARPSGVDEANLFHLVSVGFGEGFNEEIAARDDMEMLRRLPGVANASVVNAVPVSGSGSGTGVRLTDDESSPSNFTAIYRVDEQAIDTMDLDIIAGEGFTIGDVRNRQRNSEAVSDITVLTETLARDLFPDEAVNDVVGNTVWVPGGIPLQVVGIVRQLQAPWQNNTIERSMLVPENVIDGSSMYLVRSEPGQRDRVMAEVEEALVAANGSRIIRDMRSLEETREGTYRIDSAMSTVLWVVIITLVFITSMGIVGLAVFGINRRRKQIGTRRALGATRPQILGYFMVENLLITGVGVTLGAVLTIAFSILLTTNFNMPAMGWHYTPLGMLALLAIGQLAVWGPSRGAARIEPAIATRSV